MTEVETPRLSHDPGTDRRRRRRRGVTDYRANLRANRSNIAIGLPLAVLGFVFVPASIRFVLAIVAIVGIRIWMLKRLEGHRLRLATLLRRRGQ